MPLEQRQTLCILTSSYIRTVFIPISYSHHIVWRLISQFHNLWWLTELSARKSDEEQVQDKEDEDGPAESEEEKNDLTDDESMTTDEDVPLSDKRLTWRPQPS